MMIDEIIIRNDEDQRLIMGSYRSMYIHRYGMDTGIDLVKHEQRPVPEHGVGGGVGLAGQEASHVFGASDITNAEETVARVRTLLDSKEESVWKFAVTKLHTLLNEIRNPLDHTSCFDASVESNLGTLFQSNQEVRYITVCLLGCLKSAIDTRSKHIRAKRNLLDGDGTGKGPHGKAGKAKALIDSALLSPETDIPMVKKIIDCLYLLALPFAFDVGVTDNSESTRLNAIQVSIAKACFENDRWRLLLTLCFAQNLAISGRCAFLFRMLVLVQGRENTEGNHWEQFQPIIDPAAFVVLLNNDATNAADYKAVQYSDHLNSTGFGTNQSSDIDSVEVLEAHLGLLVLDYASHLLNARHEAPSGAKRDRKDLPSPDTGNPEESPVETARGRRGIAAFEKILAKTDAAADRSRRGLPSKLSEVEIGEENGVEYVSKIVPKCATSSDKYVLEDVFMDDNKKLFLKLWRMANYTEMPSLESQGRPRDSLRISTCYQQRRFSLDIISQLVAMDSSFKDQLNRLAGAAKLIALMADKSIMRVSLDDYGGGPPVSPRFDDPNSKSDTEDKDDAQSEVESKEEDSIDKGKVDANDVISRQVDVEAVRYTLKILVTVIVSQDLPRQKTIVRLINDTQVGGQKDIKLEHVAQIDRQSAFFYATILTLGNRFD